MLFLSTSRTVTPMSPRPPRCLESAALILEKLPATVVVAAADEAAAVAARVRRVRCSCRGARRSRAWTRAGPSGGSGCSSSCRGSLERTRARRETPDE